MDLFHVWFKRKTLPWTCAKKLLMWLHIKSFLFHNFSRYFSFAYVGYHQNLKIYTYAPIHPCSDYVKIFAVCILALGNLPGNFRGVFQFLPQNPKSYVTLLSFNCFMDFFHVWFKGKTLFWTVLLVFGVIMIIKKMLLEFFRIFQFCSFYQLLKFDNIAMLWESTLPWPYVD